MDGSSSSLSSTAQRAQAHFAAGKYAEAVDLLAQLGSWEDRGSDKKSQDDKKGKDAGKDKGGPMKTRVQHNLALSQLLAGKSKFGDFEGAVMHLLSEMQVSVSQMQQSQGENPSNAMLGLGMKLRKEKDWEEDQDFDGHKGNSVFSGVNLSFQTLAMERDASLLRYNLAVVYFRQKKYAAATSILDVLLRAIEPMDETVAMHICFLYLDVILHSSRSSSTSEAAHSQLRHKAQAIVSYLESPHGFNGLIAPSTENKKSKASFEANVVEFKFRLHLYKAKLALMHENLKTAKKEVKAAMEIFQKEIKAKEKPNDNSPLSVQIGIGVGSIFHPPVAVQNSSALFLKANSEYLRRNFKKCIKLVASCKKQSVDESIYLNNLGCIHNQMGHHQAAQSYFAKALEATSQRPKQGSKQEVASHLTSSVQAEILYNNGLQLLLLKKYALAFRCLHASSKLFFNRPKLWLRLGECCTASYAAQRESIPTEYKNSLVSSVVGHGAHRRVVLPVRLPTDDAVTESNSSDAVPTMNLPFAVKCFRNALLLTQQLLETKASDPTAHVSDQSAGDGANGDAPQSLTLAQSLDLMRQKALVNLVFAYLSMNAPELAVTTAKELLAIGTCTPANRYLVRSYYAEALCMLSRSAEASSQLKPNEMLGLAEAYSSEAKVDVATVQANLHVNNASTAILQKNLSVAEQSVAQAVRLAPTSHHSLELLVYVLLRKGNSKKAMQILKEARVAN
ncbi:Aste57867_20881 [Aphanomyces stellatus]|uniref:Aste57867_20881 protein n=1 Tax=Aphanomyces stellatus TaxID=120398 RepID=A0A485LG64_9STRA|nr:hypothetical protein As57867_020813 [Aphanomyces stellatus]VFT97558.1 Aste57867_20881 [Aphanomyces stellatus]